MQAGGAILSLGVEEVAGRIVDHDWDPAQLPGEERLAKERRSHAYPLPWRPRQVETVAPWDEHGDGGGDGPVLPEEQSEKGAARTAWPGVGGGDGQDRGWLVGGRARGSGRSPDQGQEREGHDRRRVSHELLLARPTQGRMAHGRAPVQGARGGLASTLL
ncbi:MAG: hypothetical protein C4307_00935 [Chloroflexota bacterium]